MKNRKWSRLKPTHVQLHIMSSSLNTQDPKFQPLSIMSILNLEKSKSKNNVNGKYFIIFIIVIIRKKGWLINICYKETHMTSWREQEGKSLWFWGEIIKQRQEVNKQIETCDKVVDTACLCELSQLKCLKRNNK